MPTLFGGLFYSISQYGIAYKKANRPKVYAKAYKVILLEVILMRCLPPFIVIVEKKEAHTLRGEIRLHPI